MSRNPNATVRAAKQAREVRAWQDLADSKPRRAKSGLCSTARLVVAGSPCGRCDCHRKDPR